ncbi:nucleotide disphospho-sugar-binding domain-containing protein [Streptomyces reniochalinae]|uniref:DUF1205 domain-containing protein n=1 Tax=Streptomyces reniochalinae TaxID=2250578 RepID=A0A367E5F0_9ACTN|nr:nucleotide disphospho-sugar-binding domain-containing protein [Streptomyces reniochalinae]RCG13284.1 DUF1205 domain-containing protein [Streptomyces reniochalinae]
MRILFIPLGLSTHYLHLVPLAWACRSAGHEVRIAGQQHAFAAIEQSGMTVTPVGERYDFVEHWKEALTELGRLIEATGGHRAGTERTPEERRRLIQLRSDPFLKSAEAMLEDLVPLARSWQPDLIVADPLVLAAPLLAETVSVPLVHHLWAPEVNDKVGFGGVRGGGLPWPDDLRRLFESYGLEPQGRYSTAVVDPCPESLQAPGIPGRMPIRYVPYNGPGTAPAWLAEPPARPRVCVTWGSTHTEMVGTHNFLVPEILAGLEKLDVETVVVVRGADRALVEPAASPERVRIVEGLPLHALLPTCDAIIHQCGSGTMLTAAALGVPQVLMPTTVDRAEISRMVADTGAGIVADTSDTAAETLRPVFEHALSDTAVRESADRLSREIAAQPSPAAVAASLDKLL